MQHQTLQNLVGRADALINAGQFDALMDFYCDDATLVVKPGFNACGKAQIRQAFDAIARHFEHSLRVRQHDLRVIEAGDTALVMAEALTQEGFAVLPSQGTYFLNLDLAASGVTVADHAFARLAVEQAGVATIPVSALYETDPVTTILRLCFAKADATLDEGAERLARARDLAAQAAGGRVI